MGVMIRYRERLTPAERAERAAANQAAKDLRNSHTMTCQICGGAYLARTGLMAHHGFHRPGYGWQTASCAGARCLPFEVTKADLNLEIASARRDLAERLRTIKIVKNEMSPITITYSYHAPDAPRWSKPETKYLHGLTRRNFEAKKLEAPDAFKNKQGDFDKTTYRHADYTFDTALQRDLAEKRQQASLLKNYIAQQEQRAAVWKQTHRAGSVKGEWVKL